MKIGCVLFPFFSRFILAGLLVGLLSGALGGCVSGHTLYAWGSYEDLLYEIYSKPGTAAPAMQVERLSRDVQRAESSGKKVPPGVYAHLGVMYTAVGDLEKAEAAFNREKLLFPESALLIDGMMARARSHQTTE